MSKLAVAATCVATVLAPFVSTAAENAANPDAIELVPVPWPVKYKGGPDAPVAFDAPRGCDSALHGAHVWF